MTMIMNYDYDRGNDDAVNDYDEKEYDDWNNDDDDENANYAGLGTAHSFAFWTHRSFTFF